MQIDLTSSNSQADQPQANVISTDGDNSEPVDMNDILEQERLEKAERQRILREHERNGAHSDRRLLRDSMFTLVVLYMHIFNVLDS